MIKYLILEKMNEIVVEVDVSFRTRRTRKDSINME
jgi:hypothetical protein